MTCKDTIRVRTTTCESRLSGRHNPYPPKHASGKPTQEPTPVLTLWQSSNFLDPVKKPVGGPPTFNPKSLGDFPGATIHDDTQLLGTCHESPLECHLRRPCRSPGCFGSRLSRGNRSFLLYPVDLHTKPRLGARRSTARKIFVSRPSSSANTLQCRNKSRWLPTPIRHCDCNIPMPYVRKSSTVD